MITLAVFGVVVWLAVMIAVMVQSTLRAAQLPPPVPSGKVAVVADDTPDDVIERRRARGEIVARVSDFTRGMPLPRS